jgi:hypothetical protein
LFIFQKSGEEYRYFKSNEQFADFYVDSFIRKSLQNELIPDILIETLNDMTLDVNNEEKYHLPSDRYVREFSGMKYLPRQFAYDNNG